MREVPGDRGRSPDPSVVSVIAGLQRARLMAVLRRMAMTAEADPDAMLLIGFATGLELAARHPQTAAEMLVELNPPLDMMDHWLSWVVFGSDEPDPDEPVN